MPVLSAKRLETSSDTIISYGSRSRPSPITPTGRAPKRPRLDIAHPPLRPTPSNHTINNVDTLMIASTKPAVPATQSNVADSDGPRLHTEATSIVDLTEDSETDEPKTARSVPTYSPTLTLKPTPPLSSGSPGLPVSPNTPALPGLPVPSTEQLLFACGFDGCGERFGAKSSMFHHRKRKHGGPLPYACNYRNCTERFATAKKLCLHRRTHKGVEEKPYKCDFDGCDWRFTFATELAGHHKTHSSTRETWACDHPGCDRTYLYRSSLQVHRKSHDNDELSPWICDYDECDKRYMEERKLDEHKTWFHVGRKCADCPDETMVFRDQQRWLYHELKIHGRNQGLCQICPFPGCGWVFFSPQELDKHQQLHLIETPIPPTFHSLLLPSSSAFVRFGVHEIVHDFMSQVPLSIRSCVDDFIVANRTPPNSLPLGLGPAHTDSRPLPPIKPALRWKASGCSRLDSMFDAFKQKEILLTNHSEALISKPSGMVKSPLIVRLHYPNYDASHYNFDFLSIGDTFNRSISLIMAKLGVWQEQCHDQVLMQDLFSRRVSRSQLSYGTYSQEVVDLHAQFADHVWNASQAKFGLLLGCEVVKQYAETRKGSDVTYVALDPTTPISKDIDSDKALHRGVWIEFFGSGLARQVRRLVFHSFHPEGFYRQAISQPVSSDLNVDPEWLKSFAMERLIDVVVALSLGRVGQHSLIVQYKRRSIPIEVRKRIYKDTATDVASSALSNTTKTLI